MRVLFFLSSVVILAVSTVVSPQAQSTSGSSSGATRVDRDTTTNTPAETLREASTVIGSLKEQPRLENLLKRARGVLIVPDAPGSGAVVISTGREAVFLGRTEREWSDPVFYKMGTFSIGRSSSPGSVVMVFLTDQAVTGFTKNNKLALSTGGTLKVVDWANAETITPATDVVVWTSTGQPASGGFGATSISPDTKQNQSYYQMAADPDAILSGRVKQTSPEASALKDAL